MSTFNINGKTYIGNNITVSEGIVIIDGKKVDDQKVPEINIIITGDIQTMDIDYCKSIEVNGNVRKLQTTSGDVKVSGNVEGDINSTSGDVEVEGNVDGSAKTVSGDIKCNSLKGNASSVSGKINIKENKGTLNL